MRLFQAEILDEWLEDSTGFGATVATSNAWALLLARAEYLKFTFVIDQIVAPVPTFAASLFGMNSDGLGELTMAFSLDPLVAGSNILTGTYGPGQATYPAPRYLVLTASIVGAGKRGHVRIWVCGRGPQLLEAVPPTPASFRTQYAAARLLADEDRVSLKKDSLRPGGSLFFPPELSEPSLKWER